MSEMAKLPVLDSILGVIR